MLYEVITPKDSADGSPMSITRTLMMITDFVRLQAQRSIVKDTGTSSSDTAEVRAAMANKMKNKPPKNAPNGIAEKAAGRAMNTRLSYNFV